ncbi:protein phosphatase Slingshot isoform X2 [Scaptodrosophila lebanonensis]|uniref:protein-serine/threonine phosphatase n=1 Tax=Drosophila lebanonensis TaxID=7225 RepID=A0A6J2T8Z0_DROLE|nr:protein phosphatase Slingshot isoform X2 [Scaptodrosophila lebanonensis]
MMKEYCIFCIHRCVSHMDGEAEDDEGHNHESREYFAGKGTELVLALKDIPNFAERRLSTDSTCSTNSTQSNNSDIQQHLQTMFDVLGSEDTLKMAVKVESQHTNRTRYLVIVSHSCRQATSERRSKITRHNSAKGAATTSSALLNTATGSGAPTAAVSVTTQRQLSVDSHKTQQQIHGAEESASNPRLSASISPNMNAQRQSLKCDAEKENSAAGDSKNTLDMEESCLLGIDCNEITTIGLVLPIFADTTIHLDGDGGFSIAVYEKTHIFKPVSVQAMWSAIQTLHKVSQKARENNFYPSGPSHDWLSSYASRIESDQSCLNEWNAMDALESRRPPSPDAIRNKPTAKEETESVIKTKLKEIMMSVDLDEVTSKYIRGRLEEILDMDLGEYKSFIDKEMLVILGQMDAPTEIFDHVYLGSEWNASNLEELQKNGVSHILNVTREIDNFFPGTFTYFNVRVYDDEKTNLLKYWDDTYRYISRARAEGSKVLVHCKMGVSRSASVVIAYAMKAYKWEFHRALQHVKDRRSCIKPNKNFLNQLETYSGMLDAMKNKEKLQRSKSETNLKSTKDARLLPGSEPTPLIQALNQAKSKSSSGEADVSTGDDQIRSTHRRASAQKQRRMVRRSSSTSPKTQTAVVTKQQSQSMENLTPERSVAEEPKNMRFPGSNGENYSVTQNQVLHIQKHTPKSVRTRVHDLEAYQPQEQRVPRQRVSSSDGQPTASGGSSTVWTSQSKLITQTSNIGSSTANAMLHRRDSTSSSDVFSTHVDNVFAKEEREKRQRRKTQSWTESFGSKGGIVLDIPLHIAAMRQSGERPRELPSRNASWGSGDNRSSQPPRFSSSSYYDSNRNTTAIFEGEIQDLKRSTTSPNTITKKTASNYNVSEPSSAHLGTVKRTKQKLEENTGLKKRCQENASTELLELSKKGTSTLCRSASSASTTRTRHPLRCNSEELMHTSDIENKNIAAIDLEGTVVLRSQVPGGMSGEDQRISGNVQILKQNFEAKAAVGIGLASTTAAPNLTTTSTTVTSAINITTKKTHQSLPSSPVAQHVDHVTNCPAATNNRGGMACSAAIAVVEAANATGGSLNASPCSSSTSNSSDSSVSETCDRNVKGLVHKYQTTSNSSCLTNAVIVPPTSTQPTLLPPHLPATNNATSFKPRPRSYYDRTQSNKTHDYSESRPPPAPARHSAQPLSNLHHQTNHHQQQQQQQQQHQVQHRRLAQHGKTHPLSRLSSPKQSFNTAAYSTILFRMIHKFRYSFDGSWAECNK